MPCPRKEETASACPSGSVLPTYAIVPRSRAARTAVADRRCRASRLGARFSPLSWQEAHDRRYTSSPSGAAPTAGLVTKHQATIETATRTILSLGNGIPASGGAAHSPRRASSQHYAKPWNRPIGAIVRMLLCVTVRGLAQTPEPPPAASPTSRNAQRDSRRAWPGGPLRVADRPLPVL